MASMTTIRIFLKRNYIVVQKDVAPVIFTHFFIKVTLDSDLLR